MQNKGLVRILAVCLALVCAFYLSFSLVTSHYDKAAKEFAADDGGFRSGHLGCSFRTQ